MRRPVKLLLTMGLLAFLLAAPFSAGAADYQDLSLAIIGDDGICRFYKGDGVDYLLTLNDSVVRDGVGSLVPNDQSGVTATYASPGEAMAGQTVNIWYFRSETALNALSQEQVDALISYIRQGAVVGISGDLVNLRNRLDVVGKHNFSDLFDNRDSASFCNATWDEAREDYSIYLGEGLSIGQAWTGVFSWAYQQLTASPSSQSNENDDVLTPWQATYTHQVADSNRYGTASLGISVFKLDTTSTIYDWYRVDFIAEGGQTAGYKYVAGFSVGWWTKHLDASLQLHSPPDLVVFDHMPDTTLSNIHKSFTIGGSLKSEIDPTKYVGPGGDVSVSYTESYDCPDMTMEDHSDTASGQASWSAMPRQPNLWGGIVWAPPATVAHTNYKYKPSMLIRTPKNQPLQASAMLELLLSHYTYYTVVYEYLNEPVFIGTGLIVGP